MVQFIFLYYFKNEKQSPSRANRSLNKRFKNP